MERKRWVIFEPDSEEWKRSLCSRDCIHVQEETSEDFPGAILRSCDLGFQRFPRTRCRFYEGPQSITKWKPRYKRDRPWISLRVPDASVLDALISLAKKDDRSLNWEIRQAVKEYLERRTREDEQ